MIFAAHGRISSIATPRCIFRITRVHSLLCLLALLYIILMMLSCPYAHADYDAYLVGVMWGKQDGPGSIRDAVGAFEHFNGTAWN